MLKNLSARERYLLIFGLLILAGVAYYFYLYLPQQETIQALERDFVVKNQELEELKILKVKYQKLSGQYEAQQARLEKYLQDFYNKEEVPQLLKDIQILAAELDLDIMTLVPGMTREEGAFLVWPLNLEMAGDYQEFVMFLDNISRDFGSYHVADFKISTSSSQILQYNLKLEFLLLKEGEQDEI